MIIMINGGKISVHRFIATTLFRMVKYGHTHQSLDIRLDIFHAEKSLFEKAENACAFFMLADSEQRLFSF